MNKELKHEDALEILKKEAEENQKNENMPVFNSVEDMFATGIFGRCIYSKSN